MNGGGFIPPDDQGGAEFAIAIGFAIALFVLALCGGCKRVPGESDESSATNGNVGNIVTTSITVIAPCMAPTPDAGALPAEAPEVKP